MECFPIFMYSLWPSLMKQPYNYVHAHSHANIYESECEKKLSCVYTKFTSPDMVISSQSRTENCKVIFMEYCRQNDSSTFTAFADHSLLLLLLPSELRIYLDMTFK